MQFKDYYQALDLQPGASEAEIKSTYRRLARKYHPDVSKEADAEDKFKAVNEAYEVLRDPKKRQAYDQLRARGFRPGQDFHPPPDWGGDFEFDASDLGDGAGFSDFFESLFGRVRGQPGAGARMRRPPPRRARLDIDLEAAYHGATRRIELGDRSLDVKIPAGILPGQNIRLAGQGGHGGDLVLEIGYQPHPRFEVNGRDVLLRLPLAPWEAALGTEVAVATLAGPVQLRVPPGSDHGRRLRLRGRGLPGTETGDQIVIIEVRAPAPADDVQRDAYLKLSEAFDGYDPRR